jgi:DNA-binding FadR family transcriptional regulator
MFYQEILQSIKRDILLGKIRPNERLPSERKLSQKYNVGRGAIRESLKALEAIGFLKVVRGRSGGYFAKENAPELFKEALSFTIEVEKSTFFESLIFRKIIEPKTCFYAAIKRTKQNIHVMERSIVDMEEGIESTEICARSNVIFHCEIGKASGNPFIEELYIHMSNMLSETGKMIHSLTSQTKAVLFFHKEILDSIKQGESERAETLMDAHLSYTHNDWIEAKKLRNE